MHPNSVSWGASCFNEFGKFSNRIQVRRNDLGFRFGTVGLTLEYPGILFLCHCFFFVSFRMKLVWRNGRRRYGRHTNGHKSYSAPWQRRRAKFTVREVTNQQVLLITIQIRMHQRSVVVVVRITWATLAAVVHLIQKVQMVQTSDYFCDLGRSLNHRSVYQITQTKVINPKMHKTYSPKCEDRILEENMRKYMREENMRAEMKGSMNHKAY